MAVLQPLVNAVWRVFHRQASPPQTVERQANLVWPQNDTYQKNWWQLGGDRPRVSSALQFSPVYSCTNIIAQECAKVPLQHWRMEDTGRRLPINSAANRVLNNPNPFQTRSDWMLYTLQSLLLEGNAYSWAQRSPRGDVIALYPLSPSGCYPYIVPETGELWYQTSQIFNYMPQLDPGAMVPASEILHLRAFCPDNPLIGETPLIAAMFAVEGGLSIESFSNSFFARQARPGGILRTAEKLGTQVARELAEMWSKATSENHSGRTAVLDRGIEWQPLTMSAVDAELIRQHDMRRAQIAEIYRVPLFYLGDYTKATFSNVETLTRIFYSSCLGFYLEHMEQAFKKFFGLGPNDKFEFNVEAALLRPELKERMDAYARGVQGGIMAPNEARARENLPPVEGGDNAFLQAQMISVEAASESQPQRVGQPGSSAGGDTDTGEEEERAVREEIRRQLKLIQGGKR